MALLKVLNEYINDKNPPNMDPFAINLTTVRERLGKSQKEVAARLGVSPSLVSKWEKGERKPDDSQFWELGRLFGVTAAFLSGQGRVVNFQARSLQPRGADEKGNLGQALNEAAEQIHHLYEVWSLCDGELPKRLPLALEYADPMLPALARTVREFLRLNTRMTYSELRSALAEKDVHVFEWRLPDRLSGLSYQRDFSVIFLNEAMPDKVKLFSLCHELAHLLFHLRGEEETAVSVVATRNDPLEKQANHFAAELLMPEAQIDEWMRLGKDALRQKRRFLAAVESFGVSPGALFYRLARRGVFSYAEKARFLTDESRQEADLTRARVDRMEQLPTGLLHRVEDLWLARKISGGKAAELCHAARAAMDKHLLACEDEEFPLSDVPLGYGEVEGLAE